MALMKKARAPSGVDMSRGSVEVRREQTFGLLDLGLRGEVAHDGRQLALDVEHPHDERVTHEHGRPEQSRRRSSMLGLRAAVAPEDLGDRVAWPGLMVKARA